MPRYLFAAFALVVTSGVIASRALDRRLRRDPVARATPSPFFDTGLGDATIRSPEAAKARRLFWLKTSRGSGAAVDLRADAALFDEAFPGYDAARADENLWTRYFSGTFEHMIPLPSLSRLDPSAAVSLSWIGNLELGRRYGADLILFGSSEAHAALPPSFFRSSGRVLDAMIGGLMPETARRAARDLGSLGLRPKAVVWGYSAWNAYKPSDYPRLERPKWESLEEWRTASSWTSRRPSDFLGRPTWDAIVGQSLQKARDDAQADRAGAAPKATAVPKSWRVDGYEVRQFPGQEGGTFPAAAAARPATLAKIAASLEPHYQLLDGATPAACDTTAAGAELDRALLEMKALAPRVLLYLPPTTPLHLRAGPECLRAAVATMLEARRAPGVIVETGDWTSYGLTWADFVHPDAEAGRLRLDLNHVNLTGARKVSARIAALVAGR